MKHPVCSQLLKNEMTSQEVRALHAIWQGNISYEELIHELPKPNGGDIILIRNVGPKLIEIMRGLVNDMQERKAIEREFDEYEKGLWQHIRMLQMGCGYFYSNEYGYA
jgi:hypothetical protein